MDGQMGTYFPSKSAPSSLTFKESASLSVTDSVLVCDGRGGDTYG